LWDLFAIDKDIKKYLEGFISCKKGCKEVTTLLDYNKYGVIKYEGIISFLNFQYAVGRNIYLRMWILCAFLIKNGIKEYPLIGDIHSTHDIYNSGKSTRKTMNEILELFEYYFLGQELAVIVIVWFDMALLGVIT